MNDSLENLWLKNRLNLATDMTLAELSRLPAVLQSNMFFTGDGIADENIVSEFRRISDAYSSGEIGRDEARNLLLRYAREAGRDDGTQSLRNLASTARLDLILDQNAKMARAVWQYEAMHRPANLKMFPYVVYQARTENYVLCQKHLQYDGMVIDKRDPWLRMHWPPWDLDCGCDLLNCTAKKAGKIGTVKPMSDPESIGIESESGWAFSPAAALAAVADGFRVYSTDELRAMLDRLF